MVVMNWGSSFSRASCLRQSRGTPRLQPTPGSSSGQRVPASRSRRSSRSAWGTSIRNGRIPVSAGSVLGMESGSFPWFGLWTPLRSVVVAVLGPLQRQVDQVHGGVGGPLDQDGEVLGVALGDRLQDVVGRVLAAGGAADADAHAQEVG